MTDLLNFILGNVNKNSSLYDEGVGHTNKLVK